MRAKQELVRSGDLSRRIGAPVRVSESGAAHDSLFKGRLSWQRLRSGLSLHCSDCIELHDFSTQVEVAPRLSFVLFMAGHSAVCYDDRSLSIAASPKRPEGIAVALTEPATFTRQAQRGTHIRKLSVCLTPEWFESGGFDAHDSLRALVDPQSQHLAMRRWVPTARLLALVELTLNQATENSLLQHLQQESRALELAHGVIAQLTGQAASPPKTQRPHEQKLVQRALELLHSGEADGWSLEQIAAAAGASASTLQRQFQAARGVSVFAYQRQHKLQLARTALLGGGVSIVEAAWLAGYSSAANFATAFRRQFGVSPQAVQKYF